MAGYQNFFPATYQPYGGYYPQSYQPMPQIQPQVQQPTQQATQQTSSILWVGSEQEAQGYPVAPNCAVPLWDSNMPVIYLKQADASGKPTIKVFDLTERGAQKPQNPVEYATRDEMDSLSQAVDSLRGEIKTVRKEFETAKKPRRREVEEDDE